MTEVCGMRNGAGIRPPSSSGVKGCGWRQPGGSLVATGSAGSRTTCGSPRGQGGGGGGAGRAGGAGRRGRGGPGRGRGPRPRRGGRRGVERGAGRPGPGSPPTRGGS